MIKTSVTATLWLVTSLALAQGEPDDQARKALAQGDYARVITLYGPAIAGGRELSDMAHYRLSIAQQKAGDSVAAWKHLRAALQLNAAGTFASSAARLGEHRASILAGCEKLNMPGCEEAAPKPQVTPQATASAHPPAVEPAASLPPSTATQTAVAPAPTASPVAASPNTADVRTRAPLMAAPGDSEPQQPRLLLWILGIASGSLWVMLWCAWRIYLRDRRTSGGLDAVENLRDNVAEILARLHSSERGRNSVLHAHLSELLPVLEREAGRALYRSTGRTAKLAAADLKAVELGRQMSSKPPDVLTAHPHDIEALFRRPALG